MEILEIFDRLTDTMFAWSAALYYDDEEKELTAELLHKYRERHDQLIHRALAHPSDETNSCLYLMPDEESDALRRRISEARKQIEERHRGMGPDDRSAAEKQKECTDALLGDYR